MVTWNALKYTKLSLNSLWENTKNSEYLLTIIDNNSSDGTQKFLKSLHKTKKFKNLKIVLNTKNIGYGRAILHGSKLFKTKYVCALNNDLLFSKGWLDIMIKEMESNPNVGLLGPLRPAPFCIHPYSDLDTNVVIESISNDLSINDELNKFTMNRDFVTFCNDLLKINFSPLKYFSGPPIHIVGCCFLVNTEIANKVGGIIDPQFPLGCEDTDLSWRMSTNGYNIAITSKTYVHHFKHKSFNKRFDNKSMERLEMYKKINKRFYSKWKNTIATFFVEQQKLGENVSEMMKDENNYSYWFMRRLNDSIRFWDGTKLVTIKN